MAKNLKSFFVARAQDNPFYPSPQLAKATKPRGPPNGEVPGRIRPGPLQAPPGTDSPGAAKATAKATAGEARGEVRATSLGSPGTRDLAPAPPRNPAISTAARRERHRGRLNGGRGRSPRNRGSAFTPPEPSPPGPVRLKPSPPDILFYSSPKRSPP